MALERGTKIFLPVTVNAETGTDSGRYWVEVPGYSGLIAIGEECLAAYLRGVHGDPLPADET
jgi:hypothetical protein